MPRKDEMRWDKHSSRWYKNWHGKRQWVSPRQLRCPPTKEASRQAANAYWKQFLTNWYGEQQDETRLYRGVLDFAYRTKPQLYEPNELAWLVKQLTDASEDEKQAVLIKLLGSNSMLKLTGSKPSESLFGDEPREDETTSYQLDEFIRHIELRHHNRQISDGSLDCYTRAARQIKELASLPTLCKDLNSTCIDEIFGTISALERKQATKSMLWKVFKTFTERACDKLALPRPQNLRDKTYNFGADECIPINWTAEEFQAEYAAHSGLDRLLLLLAANCGFYGVDMAHLEWDGSETIARYRSKTGKKGAKVTFHLWQETQDLLRVHGKELPALYQSSVVDGKRKLVNKVSNFSQKLVKAIKWLRHTSAQFLEDSEVYRQYKDYFLGHAASRISEINYTTPTTPKQMFAYLHTCYFAK